MTFGKISALFSCVLLLSACDMMPSWLGGEEEDKPKLQGTRIEVLNDYVAIKADSSMADVNVTVPEQRTNDSWAEAAGSPQGLTGNLQVSDYKHHDRIHIGDDNKWEQPLYTTPIVANGVVYAMDSKGYITAHDASNIDKVKWTSKAIVGEDESDVLGGGLAFDNNHLYVTTGRGKIFALDADGKESWHQYIGVPLRAAPKVKAGKVYAVSVDNQLFAFDADKGTQLWNHRGINENAGFLAAISPAVSDAIVIAPYSSGELHALDSVSGQDLWNDSLLKPHHNLATFGFSGIGGNPIIADDVVYAAGSNGFIAAFTLENGRRLWEQDISSLNTPWVSGDFLYVLSVDSQLACLSRMDGRIKWVVQLPHYENEKKRKNQYSWLGPVMANGQLLVAGTRGEMLVLSPKDGTTIEKVDIPDDITNAPVIAGGRLYFVTTDARLHVLY